MLSKFRQFRLSSSNFGQLPCVQEMEETEKLRNAHMSYRVLVYILSVSLESGTIALHRESLAHIS